MSEEIFPFKETLTAAAPFIKSIVDTFVTPKLETLRKRFNLDKKKYYIPTEDHFQEYFYRVYKKSSVVSTLVFNNTQRLLREIFIPLTIKQPIDKGLSMKVDGYPKQILDK